MKNPFQITPCDRKEAQSIVASLNEYNLSQVPPVFSELWKPIEYVAKNKKNDIVGGVLSGIGYWGGLEIKILWVHEDYRSKGLGSQLLNTAEQKAILQGATIATLDTFSFQAENFYLKNGYTIFGTLENFPAGHHRSYFSKKLKK